MVSIEAATTADAPELVELWVALAEEQRAYESHISGESNRSQIRESLLRHIAGERVLVARETDIRGFVMLGREQGSFEQDRSRGIIENLYVAPAHRNEGIGSRLLAAAEEQFRAAGLDAVVLNAMAGNEAARRLYRRHDYIPHRIEFEKRL